ncbi:MAG: 3-oxoacyl-ACP reductase FabG [Candidatus Kariarchaeaceae archaeon]
MKNKVCLITGSSRGIGKAIAISFAEQGAIVIVNYAENDEKATEVIAKIDEIGSQGRMYKARVENPEEVNAMVDQVINEFGRIDILINNAAVYFDNVVWKMPDSVWDEVIDTTLKGTFNCTRAVINYMRSNNYGRIINISSVVGQVGIFGTSNYSAAKSGLFGFTKAVAKEVANKNITVNVLTLGYFNTGMNSRLSENVRKQTLELIPMGRFGEIDEVSDFVLFLASNYSSYLTGQVIHLNGGYYM